MNSNDENNDNHNKDDNDMNNDEDHVFLCNNQPWLDAFLAEWGVISTMMMTTMRTTTITKNKDYNNMNNDDNFVF